MTLAAGREFLSIPGPTVIPDAVLAAMQRPAVDIYSGSLVALTDGLLADMSKIFRTAGRSYIYAANGHGAWEAALTNVLSRGDKVLVLESGRFAIGWGEAAGVLGCEVEILPGDFRRAVKPEAVEARLKADRKGEIKALLVAQIDTASGVVNDIKAIGEAVRAAGHDALLMVDTVASLGCMPFEMDAWGVDLAMAGSQKGLMTPPGLGFTAAGPRAREAHKNADLVHALLGLDVPRGRAALPQVLRHAAGAPAVRAARRARHDLRRGTGERVSPPPPARGGDAPRGRRMGRGTGDRVQRLRAGGALRHGDGHRHAQRRERAAAGRLLRARNAAWCSGARSAIQRARASASRIWATSTRR